MGYIRWVCVVLFRLVYLIRTRGKYLPFSQKQAHFTAFRNAGFSFKEARRIVWGLWIDRSIREVEELRSSEQKSVNPNVQVQMNFMTPPHMPDMTATGKRFIEEQQRLRMRRRGHG